MNVFTRAEVADPITTEVIRNKLEGIANEMELTLLKSSFSPIVKEGLDTSASLFTVNGETLAQACAIPVHLATLIPALGDAGVGEGTIRLRPRSRKGIIVVLLHGPDCEACRDYVSRLGELEEQIEDWDGRIVLVSTEEPAAGSPSLFDAPASFHQARDDGDVFVRKAGVSPPAVFVADQWGELFAVEGASDDHRFVIQPEEVVDWLRFLAIKCPECEGEAY